MADTPAQVDIPNRALFKAAEVCELAKVQPYVLRSWEAEFQDLGVTRNGSTSRVYRREDVERVLRIKHLLLVEGLTLAGARRKLEEEAEPPLDEMLIDEPATVAAVSAEMRERIGAVKRGLQSLLDLLALPASESVTPVLTEQGAAAGSDFALTAGERREREPKASRRSSADDEPAPRAAAPRRKRSA